MNFRLGQCPVVDSHVVDNPVKTITTAVEAGTLSNIDIHRRIEL